MPQLNCASTNADSSFGDLKYPITLIPTQILSALNAHPPILTNPKLPNKPVLNLPPEPKAPTVFNKTAPKKSYVPTLIGGILAAATFSALFGGFGLIIALIFSICLNRYRTRLYLIKLENYQRNKNKSNEENEEFPLIKKTWTEDVEKRRKEHEQEMRMWQQRVVQIQKEYPGEVSKYRRCRVRQVLEKTSSYTGEGSKAEKGWAEYPENCSFGAKLRKYFPNKIHIELLVENYTPDFAYIDYKTGLHIDIEIDEPYTPRQYPNGKELRIIHHINWRDEHSDSDRNRVFEEFGWVVIRFSERQVIKQTESCCMEIAKLIYQVLGDEAVMVPFANTPTLNEEPCWSENMARTMAENRERLNYSG